jgi:hypothetical protein
MGLPIADTEARIVDWKPARAKYPLAKSERSSFAGASDEGYWS